MEFAMNARPSFARLVPMSLLTSVLALASMGCDGAAVNTSTTATQPLTAQLDTVQNAQTFELTVMVSEPSDVELGAFEHVEPYEAEAVLEAGVDLYPRFTGVTEVVDLTETVAATIDAMTSNQYVGEKEVLEEVRNPFFFKSLPLTECQGAFPCEVRLRVEVHLLDLSVTEALHLQGEAWVSSEHFDVEIVEVTAFPIH